VNRPPAGRLVALLVALTVAFVAISVRLAFLQVSGHAAELQDQGLEWRVRTIALPAERGQILDRDGDRLAMSTPAVDVYADPRYVDDPWTTASRLSPLLRVGIPDLVEALSSDTTFVYLARQVEPDVAERVRALGLGGIGYLDSTTRTYPAGALASQVVGFVGLDGAGLSGLELGYQDVLAGMPGERTIELDPYGRPIAGGIDTEMAPVAGSSLQLTIDRELQYQVQVALEEAVQEEGARGGTVIVMDPSSGEVIAMATYPWFDPNAFGESPAWTYRNRAITDAFEPGSTNKVITAAAAIQEGALPLDERLTVPWTMRVGDYLIHDSHPHPVQHLMLADVIAQSSNIGAVQVANRVGAPAMASYLSLFGLGRQTDVGFPGESGGIMLPLYRWSEASLATIAYGQGISATPLQMTSVFATIANDGRWVQPRLVRGTFDPDGGFHEADPAGSRRVISAGSAEMVTRMLVYAVEHGTGSNARIPGYQVAGKTGTARIAAKDRAGYLEGQYIASFIGFLPAGDPQVVIAAILDRPAAGYGGIAAAPLFREVARAAITHLGVTPAERLPLPPHALPVG
jgi:cell division protein FtsI (penicillin-binding protein 3)